MAITASKYFKTKKIIDLINHDEISNNIFLFYRATPNDDYTYLGTLKYLNHDEDSGGENEPVNFNWQLINWPIEKNILEDLNIKLEPGLDIEKNIQEEKFILSEAPEKKSKKRGMV